MQDHSTRKGKQRTSLADRFWARVDRAGPVPSHQPQLGPCWLWTGALTTSGYGAITLGEPPYQTLTTHRVAWTLEYGPIPEGLWVLHRCDVRPCVNPDHLFLGTASDNNRDRQRKGRGRTWVVERKHAHGERHGMARLTDAHVLEMRWRYGRRMGSLRDLARRYGVSRSLVQQIVTGQVWRHLL